MEFPVRIYKQPRIKNPYLIVGWSDAGLVGIRGIDYLIDKLKPGELGQIEPYDFFLTPHSLVKAGVLQAIEFPKTSFYYWKGKKSVGDLIIFGSSPPALKHYAFAGLVVDVAEHFEVKRIYTIGGVYASIAHIEEPRVFAVVNNRRLKDYLTDYDVELGLDYHGPTSMNGIILSIAKLRNIDGISLWGQVPNYIGDIPNPRVCQAVLRVLSRMLGIDFDFTEIEAEAQYADKQIGELVSYIRQQNPDFDQYIDKLEKGIRVEASAEDRQRFFEEIEEFLRRQKGESKGG